MNQLKPLRARGTLAQRLKRHKKRLKRIVQGKSKLKAVDL